MGIRQEDELHGPRQVQPSTRIKQREFLAAYRHCGIVRRAAAITGTPHYSITYWRRNFADFDREYREVQQEILARVEDVAYELALTGDPKMISLLLTKLDPKFKQAAVKVEVERSPRVSGMTREQAALKIAEFVESDDA